MAWSQMTDDRDKQFSGESGSKVAYSLEQGGNRRSGFDRRRFSYDAHIPERRSGKERRSSIERRNGVGFRMSPKERSDMERRATFA